MPRSKLDRGDMFAYPVKDPERYGVVQFDQQGRAFEHEGEARTSPLELCIIPGIIFL